MKNTDPSRYENTASHLFCLTLSDALSVLCCSKMQRIKQTDIRMENAYLFSSKMSLPTFPLYVLELDKDPLCVVRPLNQAALFTLPTVKLHAGVSVIAYSCAAAT